LWVDQGSEPEELWGRAVSFLAGFEVEGGSLHSSSMVLLWVDLGSEPEELWGRAVSLFPGVEVEGGSLHSSSMVLLWVDCESEPKELWGRGESNRMLLEKARKLHFSRNMEGVTSTKYS